MALTVAYNNIEITYDETSNRWKFELRGRERSAESLAAAKEAIAKAPPKDKRPFEKFEAWLMQYSGEPERVTVTSEAEPSRYSDPSFWVMQGKQRSKQRASQLYPCNEHNDGLVVDIVKLQMEIGRLEKTKEQRKRMMKPAKAPEPETEA